MTSKSNARQLSPRMHGLAQASFKILKDVKMLQDLCPSGFNCSTLACRRAHAHSSCHLLRTHSSVASGVLLSVYVICGHSEAVCNAGPSAFVADPCLESAMDYGAENHTCTHALRFDSGRLTPWVNFMMHCTCTMHLHTRGGTNTGFPGVRTLCGVEVEQHMWVSGISLRA